MFDDIRTAGSAASLLAAAAAIALAAAASAPRSAAGPTSPATTVPALPVTPGHQVLGTDPPHSGRFTLAQWVALVNHDCAADQTNASTYVVRLSEAARGQATAGQLRELAADLQNDTKSDPGEPAYPDPSDPGRSRAVDAMAPILKSIADVAALAQAVDRGDHSHDLTAVASIGGQLTKGLARLQALGADKCS